MKNNNEINHNDLTIIKHSKIYNYYKNLCEENKEKYPEVADYIARSYYYNIISEVYDLTPNYICSIICRIVNNEKSFEVELLRANMNVEIEALD